MDTPSEVQRYMRLRDHFSHIGDIGMVRECDAMLARLGVKYVHAPVDDVAPVLERAVSLEVPAKRGPGRPRKVR